MSDTTITAGSLFCFSTGEYSDFNYAGHFVALEDIPRTRLLELGEECKREHKRLDALEDEWLAQKEEDRVGDFPMCPSIHGMFIAAVIKAGLALSLTCSELHIGSYGELDVSC